MPQISATNANISADNEPARRIPEAQNGKGQQPLSPPRLTARTSELLALSDCKPVSRRVECLSLTIAKSKF
jgi:hypothetical protein